MSDISELVLDAAEVLGDLRRQSRDPKQRLAYTSAYLGLVQAVFYDRPDQLRAYVRLYLERADYQ